MNHKYCGLFLTIVCILMSSKNEVWAQEAPRKIDIKIDSIIGERVSDAILLISIINDSDEEITILPPLYFQNDFYTSYPNYWTTKFNEPNCEQLFQDAQRVCPKLSDFVAIPPSDSCSIKLNLSKSLGFLRCEEDLDFKFKVNYNPTLKRNLNFCEEEIRIKIGELDQIILTGQEVVLPFKKRR